ncbi:MAG TPA: CerR family C-terminal domain-containing protein [Sedimentisphaerales bacterium]|nr:CerR family C-terminal domain-containing protein [Sedimentisphaerales bacterium]
MVMPQDNETNSNTNKGVRDRLLDAAEELFCEHGFEGASIRDIAAIAKCNIASVNYYFGGKEKLYEEVWRRHLIPMRDARIVSVNKVMTESDGKPKLEDLLKTFADAFIGPMIDDNRARRFSTLMAREWIDRRLPANMFLDDIIKPTMTAMQKALVNACPGLDESKIPLLVESITGQLVHVAHTKAMLEQASVSGLPIFNLAEAIDHIVKFSAAGIRAYAEDKSE